MPLGLAQRVGGEGYGSELSNSKSGSVVGAIGPIPLEEKRIEIEEEL